MWLRKTQLVLFLLYSLSSGSLRADEGMWLLPYIGEYNLPSMIELGWEMGAEDVYAPDGSGLFRAIVNVGNVGSGSVVSDRGLILTNHHVIYDHLQRISTLDNDILTDGYWANSIHEEIPLNGLSVSFLREIRDVTEKVNSRIAAHVDEQGSEPSGRLINREITREATAGTHYRAYVMSFFRGAKQLLFVYEVFDDVRLAGAPPSSIGKFGGDTDNFIWPRHAGDFAFIRVYADGANQPASYDANNVPYTPDHFLTLDQKGVSEGDFAMTLGYPGSSQRYYTSFEVAELLHTSLPARIMAREKRLQIIREDMLDDDEIRLHYASAVFNSGNGLKLAQGQYEQLTVNNTVEVKQQREQAFVDWLYSAGTTYDDYHEALPIIENVTRQRRTTLFAHQLLNEALLMGTEIYVAGIRANIFNRVYQDDHPDDDELQRALERLGNSQRGFYDSYSPSTDRKVSKAMFHLVREQLAEDFLPDIFAWIDEHFDGCSDSFVDHMFDESFLTDQKRFYAFLENPDRVVIGEDPVIRYAVSVYDKAIELRDLNNAHNTDYARGRDLYLEAYRIMHEESPLYPDANFTMRMSYGSVQGYSPRDAVYYDYFTTLDGVIAKADSGHHEFVVPKRLYELYEDGDFSPYATEGPLAVAFITNNDITGGNSGSPVINARGQISGLVFCGNWESLNNNVIYTDETNRAINVDIRYVLFVTDNFARSSHIMNELQLVW